MANALSVQIQQAILVLHAQGRSLRRIARELGVHRNTVRSYLGGEEADSKCTTSSCSASGNWPSNTERPPMLPR